MGAALNHPIRINLNETQICEMFNNGVSVNALAKHFSVDRNVIRHRLKKNGVVLRSQSESMLVRMAQTSIEDRKKLVAKANETVRNLPKEFHHENACKQAVSKQRTGSKIGMLESVFMNTLSNVGLNPIAQLAVGPYNIDIACGSVAIEVHNTTANPNSIPRLQERIKYLLKRGWHVIYVKINRRAQLEQITLDQIVSICEIASRNPSIRCEYWMVRCTGETVAIACLDGDNISFIPILKSVFNHSFVHVA